MEAAIRLGCTIMKGTYERQPLTGVPPRSGSRRTLRYWRASTYLGPKKHLAETRTGIQEKVSTEPKTTRPQAACQAFGLGPRFPRHGLVDRFGGLHLADEFFIGHALAGD